MSEEMANSHMLVYSPVTESSFKSRRLPNSQVNVSCTFSGVFPLPNVKLTWGKFDLFADKMTAEANPYSECYEVVTFLIFVFIFFYFSLWRWPFTKFWSTRSSLLRQSSAARLKYLGQTTLSGRRVGKTQRKYSSSDTVSWVLRVLYSSHNFLFWVGGINYQIYIYYLCMEEQTLFLC